MLDKCADVLSGVLLALDVLFVFLNPQFGGVIGRGGGEFCAVPSKKIYISSNTSYTSILFYILIHPALKSIHLKCVGLNLPTVEDDVFSTAWFYKFTPINSKKKRLCINCFRIHLGCKFIEDGKL